MPATENSRSPPPMRVPSSSPTVPDALALAETIQQLVRPLVAATPAPRALPYLGLDHPSGTPLDLLDHLVERGIFRKYESVLDLGSPLGAVSRWMAGRLGCDAVAVTPTADAARAAELLTRRTTLRSQVRCLAATPGHLPFADARFTHAWLVEVLDDVPDPAAVLRETWRVIRPGGWLGVQALVDAAAGAPTNSAHGPLHEAALRAGFIDLRTTDRTADAVERSARVIAARRTLHDRLRALPGAFGAWSAVAQRTSDAVATGRCRLVQMVGRRPG